MNNNILLVDDEETLAFFIQQYLHKKGYVVDVCSTITAAEKKIEADLPEILLLDLQLPDGSGLDFYLNLKKRGIIIPTVIITAHGSVHTAVEALKNGVDDYIIKPFQMEELEYVLQKETEKYKSLHQLRYYLKQAQNALEGDYFVGTNPTMVNIHEMALKIAMTPEASVMIEGPSGTGKEMLARYIHQHSPQKEEPFVEINCAALPPQLLESELFGYEPGAFTDAKKRKLGLIELANNGTLFLDEIGEMDVGTQAKLLRFIEHRKFKRLGGIHDISVSVRIVAATNKDIRQLVQEKKFREDLYFRLSTFHLHLPPLKERNEDLIPMAQFFLQKLAGKMRKNITSFSEDALQMIAKYPWPGNIRELHNAVERAVILCDEEQILAKYLHCAYQEKDGSADFHTDLTALGEKSLTEYIEELEKKLVVEALEKAKGNQVQAAQILRIPRHVIRYLIKKYRLQ